MSENSGFYYCSFNPNLYQIPLNKDVLQTVIGAVDGTRWGVAQAQSGTRVGVDP